MEIYCNIPKRGQKLTNGDVIKALFPSAVYNENQYLTVTMDCQVRDAMHFVSQFDLDWWNAPYKEQKNGANKQA